MPCPPRMQPIASGFCSLIAAMSRPSWKPGRRHGTHTTLPSKIDLGELLAVRGGRDRDAGVGVQVVDVRRVDEAVHRGVDRRRGTTLAVQAVVERRDHLVLAVHARVDVDQGAHPVQAEHRQAALLEGAEVAAGALHPEQLDVLAGDRVLLDALGGGVAAGVVGVPRVRRRDGSTGRPARQRWGSGCCSPWWLSSILPGCRRLGRPRSAAGSRWRRRPPSGRPAARAPRASRPGHAVRRCRTRP